VCHIVSFSLPKKKISAQKEEAEMRSSGKRRTAKKNTLNKYYPAN
jgi:hypothetical protein